MLVSLQWLKEFVPYEGTVEALADKLTMLGLEVDEIFHPFEALEQLVVGHVVECDRHPDADKLSLTKVDVGDGEPLQIVCGAPNVRKGLKVAVAKVGAVLPGDFKIKKSKIRGVASFGMICSERELELSDDHGGIMELPEELVPGTNLVDALNLERTVLDIDLTPNRMDCLSILGVAREVAMAFDLPLKTPFPKLEEAGTPAEEQVKIVIDDPEDCKLFQAKVITDVQIGPSPAWVRYRLKAVGIRPISNVVDVTNLVMMELGHPMHAYDRELVKGATLRVAPATDGGVLTTLDGQERKLLDTDIAIWDAETMVGLGGVMGGLETEINDHSSNVLLECAVFNPARVRKTARRLALHSEASHRFERGVDHPGAKRSIRRAAALLAELSGGTICPGTAIAEPVDYEQSRLHFRPSFARDVLGIPVENQFCIKTLTALGCTIEEEDSSDWLVFPPSHRLDLEREIDLVEEIGRVYGLDRIPATLPSVSRKMDAKNTASGFQFISKVKHWSRGVGLSECINYSFVGDEDLDFLGLPKEGRVHIANPLSEDQNVMRTDLASGLVRTLRHNIAQGNINLRLFEVANTFFKDADSDTETREETRLSILLHGTRNYGGYPWNDEEMSEYSDVKGLVEDLLRHLGLEKTEITFESATEHCWMRPAVRVTVNGTEIGLVGMLRADLADACKARADVWMADLSINVLRSLVEANAVMFTELPVYPPSRRDVTFVAPKGLMIGAVIEAAQAQGEKLLVDVALKDEFKPEGADESNLTFRMTYRSATKTLKDKEVDKAHKKLVDGISAKLGVTMQG